MPSATSLTAAWSGGLAASARLPAPAVFEPRVSASPVVVPGRAGYLDRLTMSTGRSLLTNE